MNRYTRTARIRDSSIGPGSSEDQHIPLLCKPGETHPSCLQFLHDGEVKELNSTALHHAHLLSLQQLQYAEFIFCHNLTYGSAVLSPGLHSILSESQNCQYELNASVRMLANHDIVIHNFHFAATDFFHFLACSVLLI